VGEIMEKIEKICCPILNEPIKGHSSAMSNREVFILFDDKINMPKKIMGCHNYKENSTCEETEDKCLYAEGFKPLFVKV
jgi:hypothetical protein